jgi:hypothetical protein
MPTEDILIVLFCLIDDWLVAHPPPRRPGPTPACPDSAILTFAIARELLGVDSERRFLRRLGREFRHLFPVLPAQSDLNRRTRWLWGALEGLREQWATWLGVEQAGLLVVDTTPVPVKDRRRVHGPDAWDGPHHLHAGFGYCAALDQWFYGFRLGLVASVSPLVPATWSLLPAAVNERDAATDLLGAARHVAVLGDRGIAGRAVTAALAAQTVTLLTPPPGRSKREQPRWVTRLLRRTRPRVEDLFNQLKDRFHLEHHRAHTVWGLLTRLAAKLAAFTLFTAWRRRGLLLE